MPDDPILNEWFPVEESHDDEKTHRRLLAEAINRVGELLSGAYVQKSGDVMTGDLQIISNHLVLGQDYPRGFDFADSAYLVLDSKTAEDDSSIVFRQGDGTGEAEIKWEMGKTTENVGDPPRFHLKRVTGGAGAEIFRDIFMVEYANAEVWLPSPVDGSKDAKFGVNTIPLFPVHVAVDSGSSRGLVVIESTDTSGSKSVALNLKATTGVNWSLGTDFGLNGGNNCYIQGTANVALFVGADTKVSVGTSEVQGTLHVRDSEDNDSRLSVRAAGSQAQNLFEVQDNAGSVRVTVDSSFNLKVIKDGGGASAQLHLETTNGTSPNRWIIRCQNSNAQLQIRDDTGSKIPLRIENGADTDLLQLGVVASNVVSIGGVVNLPNSVAVHTGSGTPEGAVTANVGSTFHRTDGGAGTSFYVKESGTGNTGWVGK